MLEDLTKLHRRGQMTRRNFYIAGPISNSTDFRERFAVGCTEVLLLGHTPVSPLDVTKTKGINDDGGEGLWLVCMRADIHALIECDGIYMLRGWEESKGARLEHLIADGLGLEIVYQPEDEFVSRADNPRLHHGINTE